jgi:DNA repair exonuclease SbcCD nuclease subunit
VTSAATTPERQAKSDLVLVHSSDLHVDGSHVGARNGGDTTAGLRSVLATARAVNADIVLLAGDTFDHGRVPGAVLDNVAHLLEAAALPIVILPGNHDPALPNSVFHRGGLLGLGNVHVLGLTNDPAVLFERQGLEIWGHAHRDYEDMAPLRAPRPRSTRWQVAMAHGHYEGPADPNGIRGGRAWRIIDADITATGADYVALGHWDRALRVGDGTVPAYYSGSPEVAHTVNVVRLGDAGEVTVSRERLTAPD